MYFYLFIVLLIFGIGDLLGVLTKAKISSVFVVMLLFLVGFMTGILPEDIIEQAGLSQIAKWTTGLLVFHMGTMINLKQLASEWRTLLTAILSMLVAMVAGFIVIPIIGREAAIVSIPIINGGIIATQVMTTKALDLGFGTAAAMGTIVYAVQKFCGTPFASHFGTKEAQRLVADYRQNKLDPLQEDVQVEESKGPSFYERNKKYYGNFTNLAIAGFFAWISYEISQVTGISLSIWAFIIGAFVSHIGIVPPRIMDEAKASGLLNMSAFASIIPSLAGISFQELGSLSVNIIVLFAVTMLALYVSFGVLPLWKILGSKYIALGVSAGQLLGFPATYLISNEIINAVAENEEERAMLDREITSKFMVSGLATVTSLSIIIAGIFEGLL